MFEHKFKCSNKVLYNVVSNMLVDNANQFSKHLDYNCNLKNIDYAYGKDVKTRVKVTDFKEFEFIKYRTHQQNKETYEICFYFDNKLKYSVDLITKIKKEQYNYALMNVVYYFKRKKKFKQMCTYLQGKINES